MFIIRMLSLNYIEFLKQFIVTSAAHMRKKLIKSSQNLLLMHNTKDIELMNRISLNYKQESFGTDSLYSQWEYF